jgi:hypothetical protein
MVAQGFQADFPGQLQAQLIGILALALWGFLIGLLICAPLGMLAHGLARPEQSAQVTTRPLPTSAPKQSGSNLGEVGHREADASSNVEVGENT